MSKYRNIDYEKYARIFKAVSNPNRLKILVYLMSCCKPGDVCNVSEITKCCVGDLGTLLSVSPSTLSHHLKELNSVGLLNMKRRGQHVDCWLDTESVEELQSFFNISPQKA